MKSNCEAAPRLRRDYPHPSCRSCGDDLTLSAPGGVRCSCGWQVPAPLRGLLARL